MKYYIVNRLTKSVVSSAYSNVRRARTRRDKLDNDYGAYIHQVVPADKLNDYLNQ